MVLAKLCWFMATNILAPYTEQELKLAVSTKLSSVILFGTKDILK